jgi:putative FmdB family regulatory protein
MPLYDYRCRGCRHEFEALVRPSDADVPTCPMCLSVDVEAAAVDVCRELR